MKTKLEEAPQSPEKAERTQQKGKFTKEELIEAVKKAFAGIKGRVYPCYLWTNGGVHRFRVNCWSDVSIQYSEFIHVIEEGKKLTVRRSNE